MMLKRGRNEKLPSLVESPQEVGDAVRRTAEHAGARVALEAGKAGTKLGAKGALVGAKAGKAGTKLGARGALFGGKAAAREKLRPARDAKLKAQLARTSHELASETSELGDAVGSLNQVIKANRRAGARGRTRTILGILIGATATYHLDPQHGRERRRASARRLGQLASRTAKRG
jgi:hypothetical protein